MELLELLKANPKAFEGVEGAETLVNSLVEAAKKANITLLANDVTDPSKPSYIPMSRFTEAIATKNQLADTVKTMEGQMVDLKKAATGNEELLGKISAFEKTNGELQTKLTKTRKDAVIDLELTKAKAKNFKAVRALLDADELEVVEKEDGSIEVKGLKEKMEAINKENGYLFGDTVPPVGGLTNPQPTDPTFKNPWSKEHFNLTEQGKIQLSDPAKAQQLKAAAGAN